MRSATHAVFIRVRCLLPSSLLLPLLSSLLLPLLLLPPPPSASAHKTRDINVILRSCARSGPDACPLSRSYDDPEYYARVVRLLSGGIPQILWQDLDSLLPATRVSPSCGSALRDVQSGLRQGQQFAFQVLDSSAKFPVAFLQDTVTSYGDYDQCLAVSPQPQHQLPRQDSPSSSLSPAASVPSWTGKYCLVDAIPETTPPANLTTQDGKIHLERHFFFADTPVFHGLCFPSSCDEEDVRQLVAAVLRPFPFRVVGDISCDTRDSISYATRIRNMTRGQVVAILALSLVACLLAAGTLLELAPLSLALNRVTGSIPAPLKQVTACFGLLSNSEALLRVPPGGGGHMLFVDYIKLVIICAGVFAHICCCLETPLGFFVLSHHSRLTQIVSGSLTQFFFNDGGLATVTFLSGFATYHALSPLIRRGDLRPGMAVLDRWLRFLPSVLAITALDFVWPLLFSGPFYSRVARFVSDKCSRNWWYNPLFISIFFPALDLCAPHTYYCSIDLNMFILGLLAIHLLVRRRWLGIGFCVSGILIGNACLFYFTSLYEVNPSVVMVHASSQKTVDYLDIVQMSLYAFFGSYFIGILLADLLHHGFRVPLRSRWHHAAWIVGIYASLTIAETSTAICNTFDLLPRHLVPLYLVGNRLSFTIFIVLLVTYISSTGASSSSQGERSSRKKKDDDDAGEEEKTSSGLTSVTGSQAGEREVTRRLRDLSQGVKECLGSRFMLLLTRLSFSIFMVNYFFIRTDFFTSRVPFETSAYPLVKRLIASAFFIFLSAIAFQLAFVAPAARLRKLAGYRVTRSPAS